MLLLFVPPCDRVAPHPPPLQFWCNNERSHLSVVPCDAPFFGNPCDKYSGHLRMLANFRSGRSLFFGNLIDDGRKIMTEVTHYRSWLK
jgi:hypothetical protein